MDQDKGIILVHLPGDRIIPRLVERLREAGAGREVLCSSDSAAIPAEIEKVLDKIEIAVGFVPWDLVSRMPRLGWVQLWSAGADGLQSRPELKSLPFQLTNTSGIHKQQITEHIFGLLLAWNRCFPRVFAARQRREWLRVGDGDVSVLSGKTMLILGYGAIGEQTARTALVFGMQVIGLRRRLGKPATERGIRLEPGTKLRELLPQADVVVNILPHTQDTTKLFGRAEFAAMKKTALYVNVGRGATTDEEALIEALKNKTITGALLDVTQKEPLPGDSPLWDLENLILTGHYGGMHPDYSALALEVTLDNLRRYVKGEPLKNLVDKNAGY
ncbi:MAG: D-2-hydroxyacid dehydrogenase [Treponema sp.]|jgi:phosphoglycerate dehydrogenase-like enzyme|nr:D-2-hydroxyacid dehydrogenase [Treponema sp.]